MRERLRDNLYEADKNLDKMMAHIIRKYNPAKAARYIIEYTTRLFHNAAKDACGEGKIMFRRTKSWWDKDCTPLHKAWNDATAKAKQTKQQE